MATELRVLLGIVCLVYAVVMTRKLILDQRRWRQQVAEYENESRLASLPDDEFVAWVKAGKPKDWP